MATHSSVLTWRIPWTEEPGGLRSIGSQRVGHDESDLACVHSFTHYLYDCISQIDIVRFLYSSFYKGKSESEVAQSCPTLSDPMDCSIPGSSIHGQEYWSGVPSPSLRHKRRGFNSRVRKNPLRREGQPTPVYLSGESHGQRSLAGYGP